MRIAVALILAGPIVGGVLVWRVVDDDSSRGVSRTRWHLTSQPTDSKVAVAAAFGGCERWDSWTVRETASTVLVEARVWSSGADACPANLGFAEITFGLKQPLGTRQLAGCMPDDDHADCTAVVPVDEWR
jgi:hypothetical protein